MNGSSSHQQAEGTPLLAGTAAEYGSWTEFSDSNNGKADGPFSLRHLSSRFGDFIAQHTGTSRPYSLLLTCACCVMCGVCIVLSFDSNEREDSEASKVV
jgi:hypothetical protein